jgi:hypothetical protein
MFGPRTPLVALVVTLLALFWVKRLITRSLQDLSIGLVNDPDVALIIYFVIVLPGVVVHELSHWTMAKLLGVRVSWPKIGPVRKGRTRRVSLGSVRVGNVDWARASLIGVAPLLGGSAVILLIGSRVLGVGELAEAMTGQGLEGFLDGLAQMIRTPDFWLWLYLIFSVSNAMLPSESDMATVRPVLIFLGIAAAIILFVTGIPAISPTVVERVNEIASYLATAFGLTLAVDLLFMAVIGVMLLITRRMRGQPAIR